MLFTLGVVTFALAILVSIALHEVGHLVPAKRFGVKVTQYMVGFGPTAWSTKRGDTEYGLKWIPLGGYIRMIGMFPPKRGEDPTQLRRSSSGPFQAMMDDARRISMEEVQPGDADRVFYKLPVRQKVIVMLGGPTMNLFLGVALLIVALSAIGAPRIDSTLQVAVVPECVVPATEARQECLPEDPASPAAAAGLLPGDVITSFDGTAVTRWEDLQKAIRASPAGPVQLSVERDGSPLTLTADLLRTERPTSVDDDTPVEVGYLGVSPDRVFGPRETTSVGELPAQIGDALWRTAGAILALPQRMVGVWDAAFGGGERELDGPIGVVGVSRIGGEVAALEDVPLYAKVSQWVALVASLNLALFVFNLVPLLPLDGGHVAGALWEGLRRQLAKLRNLPDPGPVDVARLLPVAYAVAVVLIGMSGLLLYADIVNPISING